MSSFGTSFQVLVFSGKHNDLPIWRAKFGAKSHNKKTREIFEGTTLVPPNTNYQTAIDIA